MVSCPRPPGVFCNVLLVIVMAERCVQKKFLLFGTDLIAVDEIEFLALLII